MADFNSTDSARETIAAFDRQIAEDENETRQYVERLRADGFDLDSDAVRTVWDNCAGRLKAIRAAREKLVQAMATIEAAKSLNTVYRMDGSARWQS